MAIKKIKLPDNTTEDINDSRLPAVTATDNGKVLSVSGGIWSANSKPSYTLDEVSDGSTRSLANYLPLSGGILSSTNQRILTINHTGNDNNAYFSIRFADVEKAALGYDTLSGLWMKNVASASGAFINIDDSGIFKYKNLYTIYHSGNFIAGTDYVSISEAETITGAKKFTGGITSSGISISATNPTLIFRNSGGLFGRLYMNAANGSFYRINSDWSAQYTVYDSGNSNKSDVAWACSTLTASGNVSIDGTTTHSSWIRLPAGNNINSIYGGYAYGLLELSSDGKNMFGRGSTSQGARPTQLFGDTFGFFNKNITNIGSLDNSGNLVVSGTVTPGSDARIKNNQKKISKEDAYSVLEKLLPKTWVWNEKAGEDMNGNSGAGLIAQEVKEVIPDAVTISETAGLKDFHSLNYNMIQGYEIAAIKGLIEEVKSLKAEIAELKKQIK